MSRLDVQLAAVHFTLPLLHEASSTGTDVTPDRRNGGDQFLPACVRTRWTTFTSKTPGLPLSDRILFLLGEGIRLAAWDGLIGNGDAPRDPVGETIPGESGSFIPPTIPWCSTG